MSSHTTSDKPPDKPSDLEHDATVDPSVGTLSHMAVRAVGAHVIGCAVEWYQQGGMENTDSPLARAVANYLEVRRAAGVSDEQP
jgi:hypothetical protein